ncbi:MAG: response regulator, partial [Myxococcales bacterium]|nr:response regulator [Myxococcales bacterium]
DLRSCLEASIRLASNEIRHRARLVFDYRDAPKVLANPSRLSQVFLSILLNAVQAIEPGKADANEVRVTLRTAPDGHATVRVGDTGSGIPARIQPLLFVPFVSTRKSGESSGLSLAIAQRVVTSIGGRIEWKTEAGRGTEITISLPPAPAMSPPVQGELPGLGLRAKERGRVLVVDDEPLIARAVSRTLRDHDVVTTTSGVEAFELIERGERFDVVVCDLMMPQMTGMDLFDKLLTVAPEQAERFIFLSGGAFTAQAREFLERVKNPRMDKPFETHALRALVRERLNR